MTNEDIAGIEARANAASPGPWDERRIGRLGNGDGESQHEQLCTPDDIGVIMLEHDGSDEGNANAEFIAHARADIPRLIAEVRRLRAVHGGVE